MIELEDLKQRASDNYAGRLGALLDAIEIAVIASDMGPGAMRAVASELRYSTTVVNRLAQMAFIPEHLIREDVKVGVYYTAMMCAEKAKLSIKEAVELALEHGWDTPAKVKRGLGLAAEPAAGKEPWLECEAVPAYDPVQHLIVLEPLDCQPPATVPARVKVRAVEVE